MGKGGGGGGPSQQTVTQTNLPEYARPYFENLLQRGQAESYRQYTPYEGERIAGFAPGQVAAQQEVAGMQTPGQFGAATGLTGAGGLQALQSGQYMPGVFAAPMTQEQQLQQFQARGPGQVRGGLGSITAAGTTEQFMSPYMQQVVDVSKRKAIEDAQKTQLAANLGAARQGTYGGARQLLATTERERALGERLGDIQATGSQAAFDAAQKAFEQEQARRLQAGLQTQQLGTQTGLANLQAALGVQQLGAQTSMQSQLANQQALMEAQKLAEQSRQYGAGLGLQGAQAAIQAGQTMGQLGTAEQAADLQRLQAQSASGAEQRALEQQQMDLAYADFLRQRDYPMEQLGYYSALLRGLPMTMGSTQTTYAQPPSMASQIGGLGLAGLGLSNLMKG